jgi:Na+:H+ antiporter, NhaA family
MRGLAMAHPVKSPSVSQASISLLREFSIPLIAGIVITLFWANLWPETYQALMHARLAGVGFEFVVNEIFMAIFFGMAAVEITDSLLPGGSLNPPKKSVAPLLATAGGVLGPAGLYLLLNAVWGNPELLRGWGIGTATDIALAWLVARLIFGKGHPAVAFLLLLAIADDGIGLAIIAVFYPDPAHLVYPLAMLLVAPAMLIAFGFRRLNTASYWPFLLIAGPVSWLGLYWAHLHPALALVFIVPFMPHKRKDTHDTVFDVAADERSVLSNFEHEWKVVVDFGLLLFGVANAGVRFSNVSTVTGLVLASLLAGKTIGITGFGLAAQALGFPLPGGMTRRDLLLVGMTAGMGLTMALFVAGAAFTDPVLQGTAKMGALGSVLIAPLAFVAKGLLGTRTTKRHRLTRVYDL